MRRVRWAVTVTAMLAPLIGLSSPAGAAAKIPVVAAEDFWGSLARQLGGEHVEVKSIIDDPGIHAHDYEPKPSDGAAFADAKVAIVNGVGYDHWAEELLDANPSSGRKVVNAGDVAGVKEDGNPHQWYSPNSVDRMIDAITDALKQADPDHAASYDTQRQVFRADKLKRYNELRAQIKASFAGTPVGTSENAFTLLAEDLGLKMQTPAAFQDAVTEGTEPTAADKATVDRQITDKQVKVFVYNSQNSTPDVVALVEKAKKAGVSVTTVTETINPKGALFQDWQVNQLQSLAAALAKATGKPVPAAVDADEAARAIAAAEAPTVTEEHHDEHDADHDHESEAAAAPSSALASTGAGGSRSLLLAGLALVLGGFGLAVGAAPRRNRSPLRGA